LANGTPYALYMSIKRLTQGYIMTKIRENLANQKEYLSVADMAAEFGIHEMTFYRMIRDKKIPAFKIGSQWRVRRQDLNKWLESHSSIPTDHA